MFFYLSDQPLFCLLIYYDERGKYLESFLSLYLPFRAGNQ